MLNAWFLNLNESLYCNDWITKEFLFIIFRVSALSKPRAREAQLSIEKKK